MKIRSQEQHSGGSTPAQWDPSDEVLPDHNQESQIRKTVPHPQQHKLLEDQTEQTEVPPSTNEEHWEAITRRRETKALRKKQNREEFKTNPPSTKGNLNPKNSLMVVRKFDNSMQLNKQLAKNCEKFDTAVKKLLTGSKRNFRERFYET
jgi:hypothetical protein